MTKMQGLSLQASAEGACSIMFGPPKIVFVFSLAFVVVFNISFL